MYKVRQKKSAPFYFFGNNLVKLCYILITFYPLPDISYYS